MKQKTAIRQLIEKLEWRIKAYTDFNNGEKDVSSMLALQDAKELESVNEQQIKEFANWIGDRPLPEYSKSTNKWRWWSNEKREYQFATTEELFNETFEKP